MPIKKFNNTKRYKENTPPELRKDPHFVCMKLTWNEEKGKFTKRLINPNTITSSEIHYGRDLAKVDDPKTWASFEKACAVTDKYDLDGIGYVLTADKNIIGIDLDLENGKLTAAGEKILADLKGKTFIENSASGAIHIFGLGEKPGTRSKGREDNSLEIYGSKAGNRCLMLTGNTIEPKVLAVKNIQPDIDAIYKDHFYVQPIERPEVPVSHTVNLAEQEIIAKIQSSSQAAKFDSLMRGDVSGHQHDYTRADLALCGIIAFYTRNEGTIDSIYRRSGLYNAMKQNEQTGVMESRSKKWDHPRAGGTTYGRETIDLAVRNVIKTYEGGKKTTESVDVKPLTVYKTTDKAVMVKIQKDNGEKEFTWLPKSQVKLDKEGKNVIQVEKRFAAEKGILENAAAGNNRKK